MITAVPAPAPPAARSDFGIGAPAPATLSDLDTFTLEYIETLRARGTKIDCADLAIEIWIRFGEAHGVPTSFSIRNRAKGSGRLRVRRRNFKSTGAYVRRVQRDLSALGLVRNTFEVPGGYRNAVSGDVFLWEYRLKKRDGSMGRRHYIGHTQIFDWAWVDPDGDASKDEIIVVQGTLPPAVPFYTTHPPAYFTTPREAIIRGRTHYGLLIGAGPRRFRSFAALP